VKIHFFDQDNIVLTSKKKMCVHDEKEKEKKKRKRKKNPKIE
jgi:hypothetical protein